MKRGAWKRIAVLTCLIATTGISATAWAQQTRDWETSVPWHNKDYFAHTGDREVKALLANVEEAHLGKGFWAYYRKGEYHYAVNDVKYVLLVFPNHPKALELLSLISLQTKKPSLPLPWFQKAVTMFPQHALTRAQFGAYLTEIGEVELAILELQRAIEMDGQLAYAHARLARVYQKKGDKEAARVAAERARTLGFKGTVPE